MSLKTVNKVFLFVGFVSLIHAAFSAAQHRSYLRQTSQESTSIPLDILIQTLVSLVIIIYNIVQIVAEFKEIRANAELQEKSWETLSNLQSFYIFNHRGKSLHPSYVPPINERVDEF
ncbi:MMGT1 family protein [Megaselia abdita]